MSNQFDESIPTPQPTPEEAQAQLGLPIEHLFLVDPLDLTEQDLHLLLRHYRSERLQFQELETKPKTIEKSRGPKLDAEASKAKINTLLATLKKKD